MTSASSVNSRARPRVLATTVLAATVLAGMLLSGCSGNSGSARTKAAPRYADGSIRLDREPGEKGYWDMPSATSLVEEGVTVATDARGKLARLFAHLKIAKIVFVDDNPSYVEGGRLAGMQSVFLDVLDPAAAFDEAAGLLGPHVAWARAPRSRANTAPVSA